MYILQNFAFSFWLDCDCILDAFGHPSFDGKCCDHRIIAEGQQFPPSSFGELWFLERERGGDVFG